MELTRHVQNVRFPCRCVPRDPLDSSGPPAELPTARLSAEDLWRGLRGSLARRGVSATAAVIAVAKTPCVPTARSRLSAVLTPGLAGVWRGLASV